MGSCPHTTTLREFYEHVYWPHRIAGRAVATDEAYRGSLRAWEQAAPPVSVTELTDEALLSFRSARLGKVSTATVNRDMRHLLAIVRFAVRKKCPRCGNRYSDYVPDIDSLPDYLRAPDSWDADEVGRIIAAAALSADRIPLGPDGELAGCRFWPALLGLAVFTGVRISALMAIPLAAYDAEKRLLRVAAETQKQRTEQVFRVHPQAAELLAAILTPRRERLFPWPYDLSGRQWPTLNRHFKQILRRAGLPTARTDMFHKLRRTNATMMRNLAGEDAARRQLGHSTLEVTRRYFDASKDDRPTAAEVLPRIPIPFNRLRIVGDTA